MRIAKVPDLSQFIRELQRRKVVRTGLAYLVAAWLLVQVADILLDAFGVADWVLRAIVVALAIGFPIAVVLAWIYDVTTQGVRRSDDIAEDTVEPAASDRQVDFVIIGVLLLALVLFAADRFGWMEFGGGDQVAQHSIAVLPFTFIGPDAESEFFADAMTEELIGRLGRIDQVQIKSRLSVARYKEADQNIDDIARELGVDLILEGVVLKSDDRVRVTTQLTDATSGFETWSDVFDGESDDWFGLHEDMAVRIAEELNLVISPQTVEKVRAHYTENPAAYDAYWRGWLLLESFHTDISHPENKIIAAEGYLVRALELDPDYPLAVAGLSLANSYYYFYGVDRSDIRLTRGMDLAERALALDPDFKEGHVALGMAFAAEDDHRTAVAEFEKALGADPDDAMVWCLLAYSCILQDPPDLAAAEESARISIRNDPTWTYSYGALGTTLLLQGRYAEAADAYQAGTEFNSNFYDLQFGLGNSHLALGNYSNALTAFEAARGINETNEVLVYLAATHAGLGQTDEAFAMLERGLEAGFADLDAIEGSPYFKLLSNDERFATLVESYRLQ